MKCNLDCSYCDDGIYGGHNNSLPHPPVNECKPTVDFMYQYVDKMMSTRIPGLKHVVLNIYGGEALNHPDIVEILKYARKQHHGYNWSLTITTTTNAIVSPNKFNKIIDLIDEFTVSWHTGNTAKQKQQFRENVMRIAAAGRRVKCVVLMHPSLFEDAQQQIEWCKQNNIRYMAKQLDHREEDTEFNYQKQQVIWFNKMYGTDLVPNDNTNLSQAGRACCGGRKLCEDQQYRNKQSFVVNRFPGWYCSVDKFFLHIKQVNGEVFTNKDCKVNYQGQIGPIGSLSNTQSILDHVGNTPAIQCIKNYCLCGLCAPKAKDLTTYKTIMRKYEISNSNLL